jgi:hypothetical protein
MSKIPVYFMPGLAASTAILKEYNFQKLILKCISLEWEIPMSELDEYAKRIAEK